MSFWGNKKSQDNLSKVSEDIFNIVYPEMLQATLESCFDSCKQSFTAPELSPGEVTCVKNCTHKWMNVREAVMDQLSVSRK